MYLFSSTLIKRPKTHGQCDTVKADIDAQLAAGTLARDQTYADAWLSGVSSLLKYGLELMIA